MKNVLTTVGRDGHGRDPAAPDRESGTRYAKASLGGCSLSRVRLRGVGELE